MGGYYVYLIGKDGHFEKRIEIVCDDDEEAIRRAKALVDGCAVELWQEGRMIRTFEPEP